MFLSFEVSPTLEVYREEEIVSVGSVAASDIGVGGGGSCLVAAIAGAVGVILGSDLEEFPDNEVDDSALLEATPSGTIAEIALSGVSVSLL